MRFYTALALAASCGLASVQAWTERFNCAQGDSCCIPASYCARGAPLEWTSEAGEIKLNGKTVHIKGMSWSGFESDEFILRGLKDGSGTTFKT
jgi:hypothetical protein